MFPFFFWYIAILYRLSNFIIFLSSTAHNLPILFLLLSFNLPISYSLFFSCLFLNFLFLGAFMLVLSDIRLFLLASTVGNNSWIVLSTVSVQIAILYFSIYSITFLFILLLFYDQSDSSLFWFLILSMSGLPPFPLFFAKLGILFTLFSYFSFIILFTILVASGLILVSYVWVFLRLFILSSFIHFS